MTLTDSQIADVDAPAAPDASLQTSPVTPRDFDPASVDKAAFTQACQAAARPHKAKITAALIAAKAKYASLMFIVVPAVIGLVILLCLCVAAIFSDKGGNAARGIAGLIKAINELFRWARRKAYAAYWAARRDAKVDVLSQALPTLGLTYAAGAGGFPLSALRSTGIVSGVGGVEDNVAGRHRGVGFQLCENVPAERKGEAPRTAGDAGWQGVLLAFDLQKKFDGRTVIVRDGGAIGNLFKGVGKKGERVTLEDPRFEKVFEVFGTDQIEARYLLTPAFMERMVELDKRFGRGRVRAAFADGRLFVVIDADRDHFEFGFADGEVSAGCTAGVLRDLDIPCRMIDALKLDAQTVA